MRKLLNWPKLLGLVLVTIMLFWGQAVFGIPWLRGFTNYDIWAADQSNSRPNLASRGVSGSWVWIWNAQDVERQMKTGQAAQPIGCNGQNQAGQGPCDVYSIFPSNLVEYSSSGPTGKTLADATGFGRLHGIIVDPQNRYMSLNLFAPTGGYVGIVDTQTKAGIALFRVSQSTSGRAVHMSNWNADGSAILIANIDGKILERIDVKRDRQGKIIAIGFNKTASLAVGKGAQIKDEPKIYLGNNGQGQPMIGRITGNYSPAAFSDLTPNGVCKENDCVGGVNGTLGGRPNNAIVCPIISEKGNVYITFGGGGLLVANSKSTPMSIVGEYENQVINGAGCGGIQTGNQVWLNSGVSAGAPGATQSSFGLYTLDDRSYKSTPNQPNQPAPVVVYKDVNNTKTIGNTTGNAANSTGQLPGVSQRRDSHGMARTLSGRYIHVADRIQNNMEVFDSKTLARTTYDLTSANGQGQGVGPCATTSITDDPNLPKNDPAPDLMQPSPDNKYMFIALRGAVPVSVDHSAQGSCPGIGVVALQNNGASGRLATVLRTSNTIDTSPASAPGGYAYQGKEHTDPHGVAVAVRSR